jgi:hypothetical protein
LRTTYDHRWNICRSIDQAFITGEELHGLYGQTLGEKDTAMRDMINRMMRQVSVAKGDTGRTVREKDNFAKNREKFYPQAGSTDKPKDPDTWYENLPRPTLPPRRISR